MCAKPLKRRYAMLVAYDGSDYAGWQMQPGRSTVQETLGNAMLSLGLPPTINGASRTDRGVHARAMVASTSARMPADPNEICEALRRVLPESIRVRKVARVPHAFHAQFNSLGKCYRYRLFLARETTSAETRSAMARFAWVLPSETMAQATLERFSMSALRQALSAMVGRRTFAGAMAGSAKQGLCDLSEARCWRQVDTAAGRMLTLRFRADRFGKYMIRTLMGIAVRCALGELDPSSLRAKLDAEEPLTQLLAPPEGLILWKVLYPRELDPFLWLGSGSG
jgi:tRNA pseudouridine38-40 synthase